MYSARPRIIAVLSVAFLLSAGLARAEESSKTIYQKTLHATAWIRSSGGSGTGWVVDRERRLLVTNHHVVEDDDRVTVIFPVFRSDGGKLIVEKSAYQDERGYRGKVLDTDVPRDLAVIQLLDPMPQSVGELKLAADSAEPSDRVHSIGNPGASDALWVYTSGTVRAVYKQKWAHFDLGRRTKTNRSAQVLETQSPINSGDSGGPVVNDKGEIVGVVSTSTQKFKGQPVQLMSTCIDVTEVKEFVNQTSRLLAPRNAADFVQRGERLYERGRWSEAISDFTEALKLDRNNGAAYRGRGLAFCRKGDHDTAIADCDQAIRLNSEDSIAYENRGFASDKKKDYDRAIADYTRAIQINPRFARAYNNRGFVYYLKKDLPRAVADYSRAIEYDPSFAVALANRADCYHDQREHVRAINDTTAALKVNPFLSYAWSVRGWALQDLKEYDLALNNFVEALEFDPKNPSFYVSLGNVLTFKDRWEQAVAQYNKALEHNRDYAPAYYYRASALEELNLPEKAQPDYKRALELNPRYAEKVKERNTRHLKVVNNTGEAVRVYVQYEYKTKDGEWVWWPNVPGAGADARFIDIATGKSAVLMDDNWKLRIRRARIWAVTASGTSATEYRNKDLWLCRESYLGRHDAMFTFTFNK